MVRDTLKWRFFIFCRHCNKSGQYVATKCRCDFFIMMLKVLLLRPSKAMPCMFYWRQLLFLVDRAEVGRYVIAKPVMAFHNGKSIFHSQTMSKTINPYS